MDAKKIWSSISFQPLSDPKKHIVITKESRIEFQRVSCDMHHYDTIDSIADKKVLVGK